MVIEILSGKGASIIEVKDVAIANQLAASGEFCQPYYSEKRDCYIFIRRKK